MEVYTMKLIPLSDRVIVKQVDAEETTKAGIILTSAAQEKPQIFEVIAVGPGGLVDGNEVEMIVEPGDQVITGKYSGTQVKVDGVDYTIVRQNDILAVVEDSQEVRNNGEKADLRRGRPARSGARRRSSCRYR